MKSIIITLGLAAATLSTSAQLYIKAGAGYQFPIAQNIVGISGSTATESEVVKGSLGAGITPGIGIGYSFSEHTAVEVGVCYLLGAKTEAVKTDNNGTRTLNFTGSALQILPALVITGRSAEKKLRPYGKAGVVLALGVKSVKEEKISNGSSVSIMNTEYKYRPGFGFHAATGVNYAINKRIALFAELGGVALSGWLQSAEVTEASLNGVDQLPNMSPEMKSWNFEDKLPSSNNKDQLTDTAPFSSIGLNIGVQISL